MGLRVLWAELGAEEVQSSMVGDGGDHVMCTNRDASSCKNTAIRCAIQCMHDVDYIHLDFQSLVPTVMSQYASCIEPAVEDSPVTFQPTPKLGIE